MSLPSALARALAAAPPPMAPAPRRARSAARAAAARAPPAAPPRAALARCAAPRAPAGPETAAAAPAATPHHNHAAPPPPPLLADAARNAAMLAELAAWRERFYVTVVPASAPGAAPLAAWTSAARRAARAGRLAPALAAALEALGFAWEVDGVTAKWHANLHAALDFRAAHGGAACDLAAALPPDLAAPGRPDWEEAARWLARQRELYARQKLRAVRVRLLREVLGAPLERERGRPRRNAHPALRREAAAFSAEAVRRAAGGEGEGAAAAPPVLEATWRGAPRPPRPPRARRR